jgi:hypothetical protein
MKSLFLAAAAALALSAGSAQAQHPLHHGGFGHGCDNCSGGHLSHIGGKVSGGWFSGGWFSGKLGGGLFSGVFCNHGSLFGGGHGHGFGGGFGAGGGLLGGGGPPINVVDPRQGGGAGQLVFPQHPFVRSPRDYFMYEER